MYFLFFLVKGGSDCANAGNTTVATVHVQWRSEKPVHASVGVFKTLRLRFLPFEDQGIVESSFERICLQNKKRKKTKA